MSKRKRRQFIATASLAFITVTVLTAIVFLLIPFSLKHIRLNLGDSEFQKGNYAKSASLFAQVFEKYPSNERAKDGVIASYEALIERESNRSDYENAYSFATDLYNICKGRDVSTVIYEDVANNFVTYLLSENRYSAAYVVYEEAVEKEITLKDYESVLGYHFLLEAQTQKSEGNFEAAVINAKTALDYLFDNGAVDDLIENYYIEWAGSCYDSADYNKALEVLNEMTWNGYDSSERDKLLLNTELALAHFYLNESDKVTAKAFVERALLIDGNNEELQNLLKILSQ